MRPINIVKYSEVPIIRLSKVLVESGLNSEKASLMRPINIEKKPSEFPIIRPPMVQLKVLVVKRLH